MNKILMSLLMGVSLSLLTACGGGSGDSDEEIVTVTGDSVAGVSPLVATTSSGSNTIDVPFEENRTYTTYFDSGYDGDIEAFVAEETSGEFTSYYPVTTLSADIPSMNVVDVQKTEAIEFLCDNDADIRGTISTDFSTGEQVISGSLNGVSQSCSSTYQTILPTTVDEDSVGDLIDSFGNEESSVLISTNCPENDALAIPDQSESFCNGKILTNVIVTDDFGAEHKFTHIVQFNYSD